MAPQQHKLSAEAKEFVVTQLACFEKPAAVVKALRREFGVSITAPSVQAYDPGKKAGARLSAHWRTLFETTRARFLQETSDIPIAHRAVRLRSLQRMADRAEAQKKFALAAQLLEQAAKEVGNAFTNARVISGPQGRPVQVQPIAPGVTVQQAADAWAALIADRPI